MDPSFFGLDGHPFNSSSERDESYITETHAALVTELRAGLKAPHGITLLIGEEGTGKTTLVRKFADESAENCTVAYLPTTGPGLRHLLTETIEQLGGSPPPAGDEQALLDCLASLARARAEHGRTTLVIVDDAHELPAKTIERVGRLFGDDPAEPSMLHVVLVGRPELLDRMNAANDRTILKHLVQVCRMDPIGPEESFRYIADRIAKVGGIVDKLFTEDALRLIVKRANGNPGRIDAICSAALEQAAETGEAAVAADTVDMACVGVESFTMESNGAAEKDPMQYIFGEEEVEDHEQRLTRRLHGNATTANGTNGTNGTNGSNGTNGTKEKQEERETEMPLPALAAPPAAQTAPRGAGTAAMLADAASAVRERFGPVSDSRKRLGVWALGLVILLAGFAATMTRTGDRGQTAERAKPTKMAAAESKVADTKAPDQVALPATAVRTSKLIVKRDGETGTSEETQPQEENAPQAAAENDVQTPSSAAAPQEHTQTITPPQAPAPAPSAVAQPAPVPAAQPSAVAEAQPPKVTAPSATATAPAPAQATPPTATAQAQQPHIAPAASAAAAAPAKAPEIKPTQLAAASTPKPAATPSPAVPPASTQKSAPAPSAALAAVPAPAAPVASAPAAPAAAAVQAPKVASTKPPTAAATSAGAKYTVQVGAFKSRANADALVAKIGKSYPDARVIVSQSGAAAVYRVVSGAFANKADANGRAKTLAAGGYPTMVRDAGQ